MRAFNDLHSSPKYYSGDKIRKYDMGEVYGTNVWIIQDINVKKIDDFVNQDVNGRKISLRTMPRFFFMENAPSCVHVGRCMSALGAV